jgi:hypothetical protein
VSDDSVALHSLDTSTTPGSGFVITGNTFEACQGIRVLGAKSLKISDNVMRRTLRSPVYVRMASSGSEGNTTQFSIDISDNTITDTFGSYGTNYVISVGCDAARALGGLSQQAGVSVAPYPYNYLNNLDSGSPVKVGMWGVRINGNIIARTLTTAAAYSDWGYGSLFDRITSNFTSDPAITSTDFQIHGINIIAPASAVQIQGNNISGCGTGFAAILLGITGTSNVQDFTNTLIQGNVIFDCPGVGINCTTLGSGAGAKQIVIQNNTFDLDPYFRAATHVADNTWSATGNVVAINVSNTIGILTGGNVFKNMGSTGHTSTTITEAHPNIVYADFIGQGDNASNKGVRQLPQAAMNVIVPIDGDPTSATYGQIANAVTTRLNAMPSAGRYVAGHRVWKDLPVVAGGAGSQYVITGWMRLTTGSNHVVNTDWLEMRTLTGT